MQFRTLALLTTLLAIAALAAVAGARPHLGGGPTGPRGERFLEEIAEQLELDAETREQIDGLFQNARQQAEPVRQALRDAHRSLRELLQADAPDRGAVLAQADRIGELETRLRRLDLTTRLDVRALLSGEQRAQLATIRAERKQSRIAPMLAACADDVDAHCPEVEDPRSLFRCMRESRDELSEACRSSLGGWKHGHGRGHEGCGARHARAPE